MKTKTILIWTGVVIGGAVILHYIIAKKNSIGNTGPSGQVPVSPTAPQHPPVGASTGNQVYSSQPGATIRSGPNVSNGFLGFYSNDLADIPLAGLWIGTWLGIKVPDSDGAINPLTQAPYNWYQITPSPAAFAVMDSSSGPYYVREDYITIK